MQNNELLQSLVIESPLRSDTGYIGYIYVFENKINGKLYIGKTTELYSRRYNEHKYNAFSKQIKTYFYNALRKYSWEEFNRYVIYQTEECSSLLIVNEIICKKEIFYIDMFRSDSPEFGYNLTKGGDGIVGYKFSEEQRKNMSKARQGKLHPNFGNFNNSTSIAVLQFDLEYNLVNKWSSMSEIERQLGYKSNNISRCCSNLLCTYKGYIWVKELDYFEGYLEKFKSRVNCKSNDKMVLQYSFIGELLAEWVSAAEASRHIGCDGSTISGAAKGKFPHGKGFIWIYKSEYTNELLQDKLSKIKGCKTYEKN